MNAVLNYKDEIISESDFEITIDVSFDSNNGVFRRYQDCNNPSKLFVVRKAGEEDRKPFAAVEFEGNTYIIPSSKQSRSDALCPVDRSTNVLSLVSLLTAKQSAGGLPPVTGVVTTIGK
jgi:hypothetical protein